MKKLLSCLSGVALIVACIFTVAKADNMQAGFLTQWVNGYKVGVHNMDCGPACCVMVDAAIRGAAPTHDTLRNVLDFLGGDHHNYEGQTGGYGYDDLINVLKNYFKYPNASYTTTSDLSVIRAFLEEKIPIIASVSQVFDPKANGNTFSVTPHWIVLIGIDADSVSILDPGRAVEVNGRGEYTLARFMEIYTGTIVFPQPATSATTHNQTNDNVQLFKQLLGMTASDAVNLLGGDYSYDSTGAEGSLDGYKFPSRGITLSYSGDPESAQVTDIYCWEGTSIGAVTVGMSTNEITGIIGEPVEIIPGDEEIYPYDLYDYQYGGLQITFIQPDGEDDPTFYAIVSN